MKDNLGDRMKVYENANRFYLTRRMPVIIRIDGKAFHTFTKGFLKPFDDIMHETMCLTAQALCKEVEGCKMAYTQSDEISLLLTDYDNLETQSWFDKNLQKIVSVSSSIATLAFNKHFQEVSSGEEPYCRKYNRATFDSRAFVIPKEDVCNYFLWRQQDATRNSILGIGQHYFSHSELQGKSCEKVQDMLLLEKGVNFNFFDIWKKRGSTIIKQEHEFNGTTRNKWVIDEDCPIFSRDREYIERFI